MPPGILTFDDIKAGGTLENLPVTEGAGAVSVWGI